MKINEVKTTNTTIPYDKVVNYVDFVIKNSFDSESGRFHQYKNDYAMAVAIISMYTDYDGDIYDFNEVMDFVYSDNWNRLTTELGKRYLTFKYYVDCEVEERKKPFSSVDETIAVIRETISQLNSLLSVIDVEKLKNYDFTNLVNAIQAIDNKDGSTQDNKQDNVQDSNIVKLNKE